MAEKDASRWDNLPGAMRGVLPAGTALRGYELISILGQGAFGITYRARDLQLHREVAIKEYLPTSLALREGRTTVVPRSAEHAEQFAWGRERFMDEARTLARLDRTPAIVRVHDFLEDNGTAYMVMALIEGETLARRLAREQRLAPDAVERLVFPLLDGLEEVHGIGFLHRDIKPANIMIDAHGRPTLIDFGASRAAMAERSTTLTAIFTPGYAAAEQFTVGQARSMDRHLRARGHALPRHHRQHPAERDRPHPQGQLRAPEHAAARRLPARPARRHRCRAGHPRRGSAARRSPNGARCCGPTVTAPRPSKPLASAAARAAWHAPPAAPARHG